MNIKKTSFEYGIAKVNGSVIWHNGTVTTEDLYPHK